MDNYSQEQFDSYVAQCQEMGFTVEAVTDTDEFDAYSEDGIPGRCPPHASVVYTQLAKRAFPGKPRFLQRPL